MRSGLLGPASWWASSCPTTQPPVFWRSTMAAVQRAAQRRDADGLLEGGDLLAREPAARRTPTTLSIAEPAPLLAVEAGQQAARPIRSGSSGPGSCTIRVEQSVQHREVAGVDRPGGERVLLEAGRDVLDGLARGPQLVARRDRHEQHGQGPRIGDGARALALVVGVVGVVEVRADLDLGGDAAPADRDRVVREQLQRAARPA